MHTRTMQRRQASRPRRQRGAALIVSLVLLGALTILGVTSMQQGTLQERMAGNTRNKVIALQAAEVALRAAEQYLDTTAVPGPFNNTNGYYQPAPPADPARWKQVDFSDASAVRTVSLADVPQDPTYIIEQLPGVPFGNAQMAGDEPMPGGTMYRITARGTGLASQAVAVVQSTYRRD